MVAVGFASVAARNMCPTQSVPALVDKAYWKGAHSVSNTLLNCFASVLATRRLGRSSWCTFEAGEKSLSVQMDWHIRLEIEDFLRQWCNWDLWTFPLHVLESGVVPWGHRCSRHTLAGSGHFSHPAAGLGVAWKRDGGIHQGCALSMVFIIALHTPWCCYLESVAGISPQLHADNLKCPPIASTLF